MNLPFMTHWPHDMPSRIAGKKTYFPESIWQGIYNFLPEMYSRSDVLYYSENGRKFDPFPNGIRSKIHTIRFMTPERAKAWEGKSIDFWINYRTPNQFRFAPRIKCTGVQRLKINHYVMTDYATSIRKGVFVEIDSMALTDSEIEFLAINDGFDNVEDFFAYFTNNKIEQKESERKSPYIIHWTNHKY